MRSGLLLEKRNLRKLKRHELRIYRLLVDVRDKWRTMIASYRLYLINRMGSLYENVMRVQIDDVYLMYSLIEKNLNELKKFNEKYDLDLELSVAIDEFQILAPAWLESFEGVVSINSEEDWRGDLDVDPGLHLPRLFRRFGANRSRAGRRCGRCRTGARRERCGGRKLDPNGHR